MEVSHCAMSRQIDKYQNGEKGSKYTRHSWIVQGKEGAIEFHFDTQPDESDDRTSMDEYIEGYGYARCGGIEVHRPGIKGKADIEECAILCGPCDIDGSSLAAVTLIERMHKKINKDMIYAELEGWYQESFMANEDDVPNIDRMPLGTLIDRTFGSLIEGGK